MLCCYIWYLRPATYFLPSAYISILLVNNWPEGIFQLRKLKYCKIKVFAKTCHPVTGTLLKTAHWIFQISYLLLISNNCNCTRGWFCSVVSENDTVIQNIIFERPVSITRQQVTISNDVLVFEIWTCRNARYSTVLHLNFPPFFHHYRDGRKKGES